MNTKKNILGICGSASRNSGNLFLLKHLAELGRAEFNMELIENLTDLPHFRTDLTANGPNNFMDVTTLLIQGIKGKVNSAGKILDKATRNELAKFLTAFVQLCGSRNKI